MGLLNFLNRRPSADAAFEHSFARPVPQSSGPSLPSSRGTHSSHSSSSRSQDEGRRPSNSWGQFRGVTVTDISSGGTSAPIKPRLVGITEGQPVDGSCDDETECRQKRPKSSGRNPRDAMRGLTLTLSSINGEKNRLNRDRTPAIGAMSPHSPATSIMPPLTPYKSDHSMASLRRRSSAFVDILDAQGEIRTYNFRSRVAASGSRDYGEDVADRNMVEKGASTSVPPLPPLMGSPLSRSKGGAFGAGAYKSAHRSERILEESALPDERVRVQPKHSNRSTTKEMPTTRRSSAAIVVQPSEPISPTSIAPETRPTASADPIEDDLQASRRKVKRSYGKIAVHGSRIMNPSQLPKMSISSSVRENAIFAESHAQSASPSRAPRFKPRQCSLPADQLQNRLPRGSVRAAREALQASVLARERFARCESVGQLLPHQRPENYYDWSRFNKSAPGEQPQSASRASDDACSTHSDDPTSLSLTTSHTRSKMEEIERNLVVWIPQRQSSIASSVLPPSDLASPRFGGSRSIRTVDATSIDISLFREMKFDTSSRSIRSRGADSCIAPDCVGPDEDSCGDSVFISPATPVKEAADLSPLTGKCVDSGFHTTGYEATSIYDSDTESFREKRRWLRPDGEALPYRDREIDGEEKCFGGLFNEAEELPAPKWAEMPITPTNVSDLGDDERSIAEGVTHAPQRGPQQGSTRPFTQRERLLALGYDYDSDSDVEASADSDEIPEERALKLLTTLMETGGTRSGRQGEQKVNMNTIAKLRREIRRRKRTGPAGRRASKAPTGNEQDCETQVTTK